MNLQGVIGKAALGTFGKLDMSHWWMFLLGVVFGMVMGLSSAYGNARWGYLSAVSEWIHAYKVLSWDHAWITRLVDQSTGSGLGAASVTAGSVMVLGALQATRRMATARRALRNRAGDQLLMLTSQRKALKDSGGIIVPKFPQLK